MKIISTKLNREKLNTGNISKDTCFFDIETTGFNRDLDIIYLIGILYFDIQEDSWIVSQYFAEKLKDERQLIIEATKFLIGFNTIINYNGNSFDIPFVNHKLKSFKTNLYLDPSKSLDLYAFIRKNKALLEIESLKLKTVEEYLGIYRNDIYSGKDCIGFYKDYILNGSSELKDRLLTHNFEDLYYLVDIIDIVDIIKDKKSFKLVKGQDTFEFLVEEMKSYRDKLILEGSVKGLGQNIIYYEDQFSIIVENQESFEIILYPYRGLVTPEKIGKFVYKNDFKVLADTKANEVYNIPQDILLLQVGSKFLLEEILILLKNLLDSIL